MLSPTNFGYVTRSLHSWQSPLCRLQAGMCIDLCCKCCHQPRVDFQQACCICCNLLYAHYKQVRACVDLRCKKHHQPSWDLPQARCIPGSHLHQNIMALCYIHLRGKCHHQPSWDLPQPGCIPGNLLHQNSIALNYMNPFSEYIHKGLFYYLNSTIKASGSN